MEAIVALWLLFGYFVDFWLLAINNSTTTIGWNVLLLAQQLRHSNDVIMRSCGAVRSF
jgi:hypothetical protein